jgi:predicted Zn-dependent protease
LELQGVRREHAKEADQLAIQYLWNSGYDPAAYIAVLRKLPNMQLKIQDRVESAMMEVQSLPEKHPYQSNSADFEAVKSYLLKRR